MARNLTKKQKGFVKDYVETGIGSLAVKKNYDVSDDATARAIASENLTKPNIVMALNESFPDEVLAEKHIQLLNAQKIEHMIFPLGPKDQDHPFLSGSRPNQNDGQEDDDNDPEAKMPEEHKERTTLTDQEIVDMLAEVNCRVKRIVHGNTARHVYFWTLDAKARKDALDMAYKIKGSYAPIKTKSLNVNVEVGPADQQLEAIRQEYLAKIKSTLAQENAQ